MGNMCLDNREQNFNWLNMNSILTNSIRVELTAKVTSTVENQLNVKEVVQRGLQSAWRRTRQEGVKENKKISLGKKEGLEEEDDRETVAVLLKLDQKLLKPEKGLSLKVKICTLSSFYQLTMIS